MTQDIEVTAAIEGATVLLVTAHPRAYFDRHADYDNFDSAYRGSQNKISYASGGSIWYIDPSSQGGRGHTADIVSVTTKQYRDEDLMFTLLPSLATARDARIIIRNDEQPT